MIEGKNSKPKDILILKSYQQPPGSYTGKHSNEIDLEERAGERRYKYQSLFPWAAWPFSKRLYTEIISGTAE